MTPLDLTVRLCRNLSAVKVEDTAMSGRIGMLNPELLDVLKQLERESLYMPPYGFDEANALGRPFEVRAVNLPRLRKSFFATTWQDLLTHHDFRFSAPQAFYIQESDYFSIIDEGDSRSRQYNNVVSLIRFLEGIADVTQGQADRLTLIFLLKEKLDLSVLYGAEDLCELCGLEAFCAEFSSTDQHTEQRKSIVKTVLFELLKNVPSDQRFKHLLKVLDEFIKRSKENFELYVTDFSFERIKEEVEANRLEYTLKLNKVFSEIQNQLLAVPAALLLIGAQLDAKADSLPKNWLVVVGVFVFSWFMNMLLKNQSNSLKAIKPEVCELKQKLELKETALIEKLTPAYCDLECRYVQQKQSLNVVDAIIAIVLGLCVLLFGRCVALW